MRNTLYGQSAAAWRVGRQRYCSCDVGERFYFQEGKTEREMDNNEEAKYLAERRIRVRNVLMALPAFAGVLIGIWTVTIGEEFFYRRSMFPREAYLAAALFFIAGSLIVAMMTYLQTGFTRSAEAVAGYIKDRVDASTLHVEDLKTLSSRMETIKASVDILTLELDEVKNFGGVLDEGERVDVVSRLRAGITSDTAATLLKEISDRVTADHLRNMGEVDLARRFDDSRKRLLSELESLGRRGNLNLTLGAVTTVIGLTMLGATVFTGAAGSNDVWSFVSHFLPRITLVLMIELFAYFFLSLYKGSLAEIKYFQNELTNIESKQVALNAAVHAGDASIVSQILLRIADTERNNVFSKDLTTVELERARLDDKSKMDFAKIIADVFPKRGDTP